MAPGYQPTGIKPWSFDFFGEKLTTATAFCVPLQTNRVWPESSNASAFGLAPNKSPGFCRVQIASITLSVRTSSTLTVSLEAFATTRYLLFGDKAIAHGCKPTCTSASTQLFCKSMTVTEPSLAMKRVGSTRTSVPRPAGPVTLLVSGRRPPQLLTYA